MQQKLRTTVFAWDTGTMIFCGVVTNINEALARIKNEPIYSRKMEIINNENHVEVTYLSGKTEKYIVKVELL